MYDQFLNKELFGPELLQLPDLATLRERLRQIRVSAVYGLRGTAGLTKLWLQYMTMLEILLNIIRYARLGSFTGNLAYLQKMLPYWAATGHNLYLKTGWLYLQSMQQLESDEPALYKDFSDRRYTARKSARALSEIPSDQLRPLKSRGGLAEKGDFTEAPRSVWLYSRNTCA